MRDELLSYYEQELKFIRRMAAEFADKYPRIAGRLVLERDKCEDPHVERLIESFALLAARIRLKIDDEFPEITDSLIQVLYPHYLSPVPSMSIAQFILDPEQGKLTGGYTVEAGSTLFSHPSQDTVCRFRTCYPVTLWPIDLSAARVESSGPVDGLGRTPAESVTLTLQTHPGVSFRDLDIGELCVFLSGESRLVHRLYEGILGDCFRVELRKPNSSDAPLALPDDCLAEVGFGRDEGMLPYSHRSFLGYRLLQEYFHFPEKFLFFRLGGLQRLREGGFDERAEVVFFFRKAAGLDRNLRADQFRLGCTPAVNLFEQTAEPIRLDHAHTEYRIIPDVRRQRVTEVYSVQSVESISPGLGTTTRFEPFYSFKHGLNRKRAQTFWHATRRPSERKEDAGTEVYLSLVDLSFRPAHPPTDVLKVEVACTNRDLPGQLPFGDPEGDFILEGGAPLKKIVCLVKPTPPLRAPLRQQARWRLISHLSLNYLSLLESGEKGRPEALQEILRLYDYSGSPVVEQQIEGVKKIQSRQVMRRIKIGDTRGLARGVQVDLEFNEDNYVGSGLYLFASVLEKFMGLYVAVNSFTELSARSQRGPIKQWPPRSGYQILV